ncbi:MAG: signal peptidase I [Clostridia bacterium]|nr:signal peptidase I [Clostridia bacterium]
MAEKTKKPVTKAKKIYNIVSTIIVALVFVVLVAVVAMMLSQRHNGEDSKLFGYYMYDVVTDSMTPTIKEGSVILSKEVKDANSELKEGDIITFTAPSGTLAGYNETHRIVRIQRKEDGTIDYIITEGDYYNPDKNPNAPEHKEDAWKLKPEAVKAKYVKTAKFIGGLREFLSHWYGYVVLIVIPMCVVMTLFIIGYVRDKAAYIKQEEEKKSGEKARLEGLSEEDKKRLLDEYLKNSPDASDKQDGGVEK